MKLFSRILKISLDIMNFDSLNYLLNLCSYLDIMPSGFLGSSLKIASRLPHTALKSAMIKDFRV